MKKKYDKTFIANEIKETVEVFREIVRVNESVINELVLKMQENDTKYVVGAGRGSSSNALLFFKYVFEILCKKPVCIATPAVTTMYSTEVQCDNALVLGFSSSGKAADVLEVIKSANKSNSITVAITNDVNSPLAKTAKYVLNLCAGKEQSITATKSFSAQIFLSLYLTAKISNNKEILCALPEYFKKLERDLPIIDMQTEKFATNLKKYDDCICLSRGVMHSISSECALKMQEVAYMNAQAFSISHFYHGPLAMISKNMPVLIFVPKYNDMLIQEFIKCRNKLEEMGTSVYIVTDSTIFIDFTGYKVARIPDNLNEYLSALSFTVFSQILAGKLSCEKGLDPDLPRSLKKITVTK